MRYAILGATVEQVKSVGATDIKEARSAGIIFATLTEEQATRLRSQGFTVTEVGEIRTAVMPPVIAPPAPVAAVPTYTASQLIRAAGFEELRGVLVPPLYGEGVNVAVVDTGIRETHEQIRGRVVHSENFTSDPMRDGFDHGTGVCSIIVTAAPECNILNMKVLGDKGNGTEEEVVLAIDYLLSLQDKESEYAPHIVNLSLGSPDDGNPNNILRVACRAALERGVWIYAAAGNSGPASETIMCPACERYVGAVGSCKLEPFVVSDFSSRGPTKEGLVKPDAVFFGENIELASSSSDTATVAKSGTSFSTPFATGALAVFWEGGEKLADIQSEKYPQYKEAIMEAYASATTPAAAIDNFLPRVVVKPQGVPAGKDNDYGCGVPFGGLIAKLFQAAPTVDINSILGMVVVMSMFGMIIPMMGKITK